MEESSFLNWLENLRKDWEALLGITAAAFFSYPKLNSILIPERAQHLTDAIVHLCLIAFCLYVLEVHWEISTPSKVETRADHRALKAVEQFRDCFRYLFKVWGALYICMAGKHAWQLVGNIPEIDEKVFHVVLYGLNNAATLMIFVCYWILAEDTTTSHKKNVPYSAAVIIWFIILFVDIFFVFMQDGTGKPMAIDWLWAIMAGVSMSLVFSRLESIFIHPPFWLIVILFSYAAIQPLWPTFDGDGNLEHLLVVYALGAKALFFAFAYWISCVQPKLFNYVLNVNKFFGHEA